MLFRSVSQSRYAPPISIEKLKNSPNSNLTKEEIKKLDKLSKERAELSKKQAELAKKQAEIAKQQAEISRKYLNTNNTFMIKVPETKNQPEIYDFWLVFSFKKFSSKEFKDKIIRIQKVRTPQMMDVEVPEPPFPPMNIENFNWTDKSKLSKAEQKKQNQDQGIQNGQE